MKMTFNDIFIDNTKKGRKILKENYHSRGKIPIIDQGKNQISGFSDEKVGIYKEIPVIIFGDHTRIIKYVDYPFLLGADGVKILSVKTNKFITKYLYYALLNYYIPDTGYNRHFKWLKNFTVNVNSINEQKRIVVTLDKIITMIDKKKKQINLLEELVKSRFIEMFGDFENSTPIGDVCTIKARIGWQGLSKKEYLLSGEYRLITGVDFNNGRINFENCYYINKERYEQDDNIKIKMGDVLVTKDGTIGKVAIVDKLDIPATLNSGVFVLRNKDNTLNNVFLVYSLLSEDFKRFIENIKIGATVPHLNQSSFVKHKIKLPPLYLQEEFSQFVEKTDKLKFEAEKSLKEMENLYESLMQKFFKQN